MAKKKVLSAAEKKKLVRASIKASGIHRKRKRRAVPKQDSNRQVYWHYVNNLEYILPHVIDMIGPELAPSLVDEGSSDEAVDQILNIADKIVRARQKLETAERERLGVSTKPGDRY